MLDSCVKKKVRDHVSAEGPSGAPIEEDARVTDEVSPSTMVRAAEVANFDLTQGHDARLARSTNSESKRGSRSSSCMMLRKLSAVGQPLNGKNASPHFVDRRRICGVDDDYWWLEPTQCDGLFNPQDDVVPGSPGVIPQIMIQADFLDGPSLEQLDGLIGPENAMPPIRCGPLIVEKHFHVCFTLKRAHQHRR